MAQFSSELLSSPQRRWLLREGDEERRRLERSGSDNPKLIRSLMRLGKRASLDIVMQSLADNQEAVMAVVRLALQRVINPLNTGGARVLNPFGGFDEVIASDAYRMVVGRYSRHILEVSEQVLSSPASELIDVDPRWETNELSFRIPYPIVGNILYSISLALVRVQDFKRAFLDPGLAHMRRHYFMNLIKWTGGDRRDFQPELVRYDEIVNILVGGSIV